MKTAGPVWLLFLLLYIQPRCTQAQAWLRHKKMLLAEGIGFTHIILLPPSSSTKSVANKTGIAIIISTEHKLSRCISIGAQTGLYVFFEIQKNTATSVPKKSETRPPITNSGYQTSYALPIGGRILFHLLEQFYVPNYCRFDVYYGFAIGAGPVFSVDKKLRWFIYAGPVTGLRYRFDKVSFFAEFGYGTNILNCGLVF